MEWPTYFLDVASNWTASIVELHDRIIYYLLLLAALVIWFLVVSVPIKSSRVVDHFSLAANGDLIELIWTVSPAVILWLIGLPSLRLLYLMDEMIDPKLTVRIMGSQWFWSVFYSDRQFDMFLVADSDLTRGYPRNLAVDNPIVLPVNTSLRLIVSSNDVIHSFALPHLALKIDAIPGRLNSSGVLLNRTGLFFGQCSELCGVLHGFMPIVLRSVSLPHFITTSCISCVPFHCFIFHSFHFRAISFADCILSIWFQRSWRINLTFSFSTILLIYRFALLRAITAILLGSCLLFFRSFSLHYHL